MKINTFPFQLKSEKCQVQLSAVWSLNIVTSTVSTLEAKIYHFQSEVFIFINCIDRGVMFWFNKSFPYKFYTSKTLPCLQLTWLRPTSCILIIISIIEQRALCLSWAAVNANNAFYHLIIEFILMSDWRAALWLLPS